MNYLADLNLIVTLGFAEDSLGRLYFNEAQFANLDLIFEEMGLFPRKVATYTKGTAITTFIIPLKDEMDIQTLKPYLCDKMAGTQLPYVVTIDKNMKVLEWFDVETRATGQLGNTQYEEFWIPDNSTYKVTNYIQDLESGKTFIKNWIQ